MLMTDGVFVQQSHRQQGRPHFAAQSIEVQAMK